METRRLTRGPIVNMQQLISPCPICNLLRGRRLNLSQFLTPTGCSCATTAVLHKSKTKAQDLRDHKAVNQALQSGAAVQTIKKFDAGSNKKTALAVSAKKLEEGTEPAGLGRVSNEVRQAIQKARLEKRMRQADLANQINERAQVVQAYENGKAVPNQAILAKMEKALGVKLRGKVGT